MSVGFEMTGRRGPLTTRRALSLTTRAVARTRPMNSTLRTRGGLVGSPTGLMGERVTFESVRVSTRVSAAPRGVLGASVLLLRAASASASLIEGVYRSPLTSIPMPYHLSSSAVHARRPSSLQ